MDTGSWLSGRKVLLPPSCLGEIDEVRRFIPVALEKQTIEQSPGLDTDAPVSRQMESAIYDHYGWPPYWAGGLGYLPIIHHPSAPPTPYSGTTIPQREDVQPDRNGDPHLRSLRHLTGFTIEASDGSIGHVDDFLIDDADWSVRYLIVDTVNWWPGKKVLVAPGWARDVNWSEHRIRVDLKREQVKESPEYDRATHLDRTYEERLYSHYQYIPYWA